MGEDRVSSMLLAAIALALALLVGGRMLSATPPRSAPEADSTVRLDRVQGRYALHISRTVELGVTLVRLDTATGDVWRMVGSAKGPWVQLGYHEPRPETPDPDDVGRFVLYETSSRLGPMLVKHDRRTGESWRMPLGPSRRWAPLGPGAEAAPGESPTPVP